MSCEACGEHIVGGERLVGSMHRHCVERLLSARQRLFRSDKRTSKQDST